MFALWYFTLFACSLNHWKTRRILSACLHFEGYSCSSIVSFFHKLLELVSLKIRHNFIQSVDLGWKKKKKSSCKLTEHIGRQTSIFCSEKSGISSVVTTRVVCEKWLDSANPFINDSNKFWLNLDGNRKCCSCPALLTPFGPYLIFIILLWLTLNNFTRFYTPHVYLRLIVTL